MKFINSYYTHIYESALKNFKKDLKNFQSSLNIQVTIKDIIESIDGVKLNLESLFPNFSKKSVMKNLQSDKNLINILDNLDLKLGIHYDSDELETLTRIPFRWRFIYNKEDIELEQPIYIMFKYYYNNKWSDINLYLVQDDYQKLLDCLTLITIELRYDINHRWFYQTSNSGNNWSLLEKVKIDNEIVESNKPTYSFKKDMLYNEILTLGKRDDITLFIY